MSIPRPKRPTYRKPDETANGERLANLAAKLPKWKDVIDAQPDGAFQAYAPAALFALDGLVTHGKFGKGIVVGLEPGKVSILFEEGVKKLIRAS
jgi:hypothetical protein